MACWQRLGVADIELLDLALFELNSRAAATDLRESQQDQSRGLPIKSVDERPGLILQSFRDEIGQARL